MNSEAPERSIRLMSMALRREQDVVLCRNRARTIAATLRFDRQQLAQLKTGSARLRICVTRSGGMAETPPRGGNLNVSYCSQSVGLKIDF